MTQRIDAKLARAVSEARMNADRLRAEGAESYGDSPAVPLSLFESDGVGLRDDGRILITADGGNALISVDVDDPSVPVAVDYGDEGDRFVTWGASTMDGDAPALITADAREALRARALGSPAVYVLDESPGNAVLKGFLMGRGGRVALSPEFAPLASALPDATSTEGSAYISTEERDDADAFAGDAWHGIVPTVLAKSAMPVSYGALMSDGVPVSLRIQVDGGRVLELTAPDADPAFDNSTAVAGPSGTVSDASTWGADLLQGKDMALVSADPMAVAMLRSAGAPAVWIRSWGQLPGLTPRAPVVGVPTVLDSGPRDDPPEMAEALRAVHGVRLSKVDRLTGTIESMFRQYPDRYTLEVVARAVVQTATAQAHRLTSEGLPFRVSNALPGIHASFGAEHQPIPTGIRQLDGLLGGGEGQPGGLEPSKIYVLGSPSSTGKTTLALNIATNIARQGRDVLYISLEQEPEEMVAKVESRMTWEWRNSQDGAGWVPRKAPDGLEPLTAMRILRGAMISGVGADLSPSETARARAIGHELTRPGGSGVRLMFLRRDPYADPDGVDGDAFTAQSVASLARRVASLTGVPPVVIVDYVQFLRAMDPRADDKAQIDQSMNVLATLARDIKAPVVAISALNRNYQTSGKDAPKDINSFLGSGGIEYTADVAMLLKNAPAIHQLKHSGDDPFEDRYTARMDVDIVKARMGATGQAHVRYVKPFDAMFDDWAEEGDDPRIARFQPWFGSPADLQDLEEEFKATAKKLKEARKGAKGKDGGDDGTAWPDRGLYPMPSMNP